MFRVPLVDGGQGGPGGHGARVSERQVRSWSRCPKRAVCLHFGSGRSQQTGIPGPWPPSWPEGYLARPGSVRLVIGQMFTDIDPN
ncbi:hypothetical protein F2P81_024682 [Scophthalmus maximus]|uniref:Uncharacterized protein n=1 Tax=Scophthalmus maximus TaxID=52904 RepID=A0A6A4RY46_SCOMX|nr:hypothetical protein F2P81_024682 [Scophthalmus maximus]